jgi:hypothetical protein
MDMEVEVEVAMEVEVEVVEVEDATRPKRCWGRRLLFKAFFSFFLHA